MSTFIHQFNAQLAEIISESIEQTVPIEVQQASADHPGEYTIVCFPLVRYTKKSPPETAQMIGELLQQKLTKWIQSFDVIKGFLNLTMTDEFYSQALQNVLDGGHQTGTDISAKKVLIEYSSPNTNKPLHLGHIRNNLLGDSMARILQAYGHEVLKTQIVNDRGIHICKSMIAWIEYGDNETPESSGLKGDKLVGKYYVLFDKKYNAEVADLIAQGTEEKLAKEQAPLLLKAKELLTKWEQNDPETIRIWKMMNEWVYDGFGVTYKALGVDFDFSDYESQTYILGKDKVLEGLQKNIFYQKEDTSIWVDLEDQKLDQKLLLRSDGTSVYMTQDIGTAITRVETHKVDQLIYTVGNEQDYHFKVLFAILDKLGYPWAKNLHHLSYGMVNLPEGKMKSREGTVVDADDLVAEVIDKARAISEELGKLDGLDDDTKQSLYNKIGLGALKYQLLKQDPQKSIMFNPKESVDFQGQTGPFIQYTYTRIQSMIRKASEVSPALVQQEMTAKEKEIIRLMHQYRGVLDKAVQTLSPALIANYVFDLVKAFNGYYQSTPILKIEDQSTRNFRLTLSTEVAKLVKHCMNLLGIQMPNKM